MEDNIKELSTYPGFNIQLNLVALLTLHVENQHAVTHFNRDTFSLYEYALIFGSSVEEAVNRVSKWAAAYYNHLASYYKLPSTSAVTLPKISIPKPAVLQVLTRNEEALMRLKLNSNVNFKFHCKFDIRMSGVKENAENWPQWLHG